MNGPWTIARIGLGLCLALGLGLGLGLGCGDDVKPIGPVTTSQGMTTATAATGADGTASGSSEGPCVAGQEGCPCTPGGACDPGLMCLSDLCVDVSGGCPVGSEGCPCTMGGGCDPGLECIDMACTDPDA
ncbi:MAG: hypothetical protein AAGF11_47390 [Myxococcota bacterium]